MPVFSNASSDQIAALRSGGWASEIRFAVCPNTVVFQATVNQTITSLAFTAFAWNGLLQGAYAEAVPGMTFFITATDDPVELRTPLLRGRVTQALTSTQFYCNESAINLTAGSIVTVIASFEILQKDRIGNLVDGFQAFENLAPLIKNMQSFYYGEDAAEASFSFAPVGQAMAEGATMTSYAWTIDGATYTSGSSSTREITITVPYGHRWAYLDATDSHGVTFRFIFEILVCPRDDTAFMYRAHDNVTLNGSVENGWNVSTSYFAGVETLLNRTRCAIVVFDIPHAGATDLFNNVAFVGYFVQETTEVSADATSSLLAQTNFELQSFTTLAGQLPVPSLAVRNVASPSAWGEMKYPTSQRTIAYLLTRYSTLANLCAIDMLFTDSTWFAGEMDLEEGTLLDSVNRIGEEIQARLVFFPQGDATFEINANFLSSSDRDALPTLLSAGDLEPQDLFSHSLPLPYYKTVGQVEAGCATFYTSGATPVKLDAIAPATARQEGNERPVVIAQLLAANLSQADAISAAKTRVGNLLEYLNPATTLPSVLSDGWHVLTPSTRVWLTYNLPGQDSTRGLPVTPSTRWLLMSVALTWNIQTGVWDVQTVPREETIGGLAQQAANISPNVINTSVPVLPILSDYDAFVPDASLNYNSTDPTRDELQPYTPFDLGPYTPMTTEDAADAADNMPDPTCALISPVLNFSSSVTRFTPRATINGREYTATAKGHAKIGIASLNYDFTIDAQGWVPIDGGIYGPQAVYYAGEGWGRAPSVPSVMRLQVVGPSVSSLTLTFNVGLSGYVQLYTVGGALVYSDTRSGSIWTITGLSLSGGVYVEIFVGFPFSLPGALRLIAASIGGGGGPVEADAFYQWDSAADGIVTNLSLLTDRGLLINGTALAVPPEWNENSEYTFTYTGDGNRTPFTYYLTDYSQAANLPLYLRVCGPNMGS